MGNYRSISIKREIDSKDHKITKDIVSINIDNGRKKFDFSGSLDEFRKLKGEEGMKLLRCLNYLWSLAYNNNGED